jgi:hypothetical protein
MTRLIALSRDYASRAVFVADTYPLRVVIFYLFYGRRAIPSGIIAKGLGYAAVVTDHQGRGRTGYAGADYAQDRE